MLTREQILIKLGAQDMDKAVQDDLLQQLADTVWTRLLQKISERLSEEDMTELEKLIEAGQDDEVESYIISKIDNYDTWSAKIEEDTINELENNRLAMDEQVDAMLKETTPID
ncbi:MAG TPA: hypothetical protein PJ993_00150 [Candidatus Saccharibacteria bacterium]|nr:hypothetical protein [Candidatus Saccharibacteria bacterium]HMT39336.1 hypothetical protein [Candidatus Saccharibacteria bacterium]